MTKKRSIIDINDANIIKITERKDVPVGIIRIIRLIDFNKIPSHSKNSSLLGAYIIFTKYGDHYVGSTNNFFRRMTSHKSLTIRGRIPVSAYLYETYNIGNAKVLENWLIYRTNPIVNYIQTRKE